MMAAPMPEELTPGFVFGGYVIRECIGRGGMARVYRAEHTNLHKAVALKVLDQWVLDKPGGRERFLREARTAASIKHPNVVDIVDVGVWGERPYIVMELLSGCDLEAELERRGALSDVEVAGLALPVIAGMIAVHEAGVVHRDIKPSNIFLCRGAEGEVVPKVLDFGISKFSDSLLEPLQGGLTKTREIVGTPTYMAPEALNGARELGPRADQYALGAVLYDCAVGHPPFDGDTLLELLKAIAMGTVEAPRSARPGISIALEDAILRAMNANPEARFETLRDLGRALWPLADERTRTIWARSFGGGVPPRSSQPTQPIAVRKQKRRQELTPQGRRGWVPLLGAMGVAGAFLVLWRCTSSGDTAAPKPSAAVASAASAALMPHAPARSVAAAPVPEAAEPEATDEPGPSGKGAALTDGDEAAAAPSKRKAAPVRRAGSSPRYAGKGRASAASKASEGLAGTAQQAERVGAGNGADLDPDLPAFFRLPSMAAETAASGPGVDDDPEMRGLFPADEPQALGANGAPLPD